MPELYRLRSMAKLFEDFQELEKQSIYFASSGELNDPMEGFRDIVWQGDQIVWTNLFRHYLYCLHMTYALIKVVGDSTKIELHDIPVRGHRDQLPTRKAVNLFEDICGRVFEKENLNEFIAKIVNAKRKAHHDEMLFYLRTLHYTALYEIQGAHIDHGLTPDSEQLGKAPTVFKAAHKISDLAQQMGDERVFRVGFEISSRMTAEQLIRHKYNTKSESKCTFEDNRELLIYDFPAAYLEQLGRILYPDWYVASFMKNYCNSSTWGHYGDNHKGICLIFEAETAAGVNSLTLNKISGQSADGEVWSSSPMKFHDVNYVDKAGEIDFFRSIGWLPQPTLMKLWYSDQDGNLSECGAHLGADGDLDAWRKKHWDNFYRDITTKSRDWEYEHESRLILSSSFSDLSEGRRRELTYDFSSLKGIIFGIGTPDNNKLRVMETIHKKCQENKRTNFEFFQAYYCHETGEIHKDKLHLNFSA